MPSVDNELTTSHLHLIGWYTHPVERLALNLIQSLIMTFLLLVLKHSILMIECILLARGPLLMVGLTIVSKLGFPTKLDIKVPFAPIPRVCGCWVVSDRI